MVETARRLQDVEYITRQQQRDDFLRTKILASGTVKDDYVLDDENVLYYAPRGEKPTLAIPRTMVAAVLSLVHTTNGHPGVAVTTLIAKSKFSWPTLRRDVREYVKSCGC